MSYLGQGLGLGREERFTATATAGQTTVTVGDDGRSISYTPNYVDVYLNGSKQVNGSDITVSSGTSIVFASGLTAGDVVDVVAPGYFQPADTVSRSLGGTFTGAVNFPSGGLNVGSGQLRVDSSGRVLNSSQPAFHASRRSSGASSTSSHSVPALPDMYYNYGSHYNTSTYRFTAPVAGKYLFTGHIIPTGLAQNSSFELWLDVNGTGGNRHFFDRRKKSEADSNTFSVGGALTIILAANDFVLLTTTLASYSDEANCIFSGYLLG